MSARAARYTSSKTRRAARTVEEEQAIREATGQVRHRTRTPGRRTRKADR